MSELAGLMHVCDGGHSRHVSFTESTFVSVANLLVTCDHKLYTIINNFLSYYQVLRPSTRQKLHVLGETYRKVLLEHLQSVPSFLGGHCSCTQCLVLAVGRQSLTDVADKREPNLNFTGELGDSYLTELPLRGSWDQILRTAIVGILMLWIFIAFVASMYGPDGHSLWFS